MTTNGSGGTSIGAVIFDLDDTLYPQAEFLDAAWDEVARAAGEAGALPVAVRAALAVVAAHGSDRGRIIDRAVVLAGEPRLDVAPLVRRFLSSCPDKMPTYPGAAEAVAAVRRRVPVGLVTDGAPDTQRAKLRAIGLEEAFDAVVLSDELGREFRKPRPEPFLAAARALGVAPSAVVVVGDRPDKDVAGARAAGMRVLRIVGGEYADRGDDLDPGSRASSLRGAVALLQGQLPPPTRTVGRTAPTRTGLRA